MSIGDLAALVGGVIALMTFVGTLLACTWHLSAKIQTLISDAKNSRMALDTHIIDYRTTILELKTRISALEHGTVAKTTEPA